MLVLATWVFTVLSRLYVGGQGDRRAFHCLVYTAAGGILYVVALLILSPALSDYLVFNLLLFVAMFLFGYLSQAIPGVNFSMQVALLAIVGAIGLNAQRPVTFQSIIGIYIGILSGMLLSSLVQRLLWPVLPSGRCVIASWNCFVSAACFWNFRRISGRSGSINDSRSSPAKR